MSRGHSRTSSSAPVAARRGANEKLGDRQRLQDPYSCSDCCKHAAALPSLPMRLFLPLGGDTSSPFTPHPEPPTCGRWRPSARKRRLSEGPAHLFAGEMPPPSAQGAFCSWPCPGLLQMRNGEQRIAGVPQPWRPVPQASARETASDS